MDKILYKSVLAWKIDTTHSYKLWYYIVDFQLKVHKNMFTTSPIPNAKGTESCFFFLFFKKFASQTVIIIKLRFGSPVKKPDTSEFYINSGVLQKKAHVPATLWCFSRVQLSKRSDFKREERARYLLSDLKYYRP